MFPVFIAMTTGMAFGYFFRKQCRYFSFLDTATAWIVRLLLFLLGFGIGGDKALLIQLPQLGLKALVLAVSAIIGSVLFASMIMGGPGRSRLRASEKNTPAVGAGIYRWKSVSGSLIAVAAFLSGLPIGMLMTGIPEPPFNPAGVVLYLLMFMVGIGAGADPTSLSIIKKHGFRLVLLPLAVVIGTMTATLVTALLWPSLPIRESLAVGAGFGYYSLSSLIIRELAGGDWAAVALLSNISREIITLLSAPLLVKAAGPTAPAAAGGATSMDTTLAATVQSAGRGWAAPALFSGFVLTLLTPFAVTLILTIH